MCAFCKHLNSLTPSFTLSKFQLCLNQSKCVSRLCALSSLCSEARGNTLFSFPGPNSIAFYSLTISPSSSARISWSCRHSWAYCFVSRSQLSFIHKVERGLSCESRNSCLFPFEERWHVGAEPPSPSLGWRVIGIWGYRLRTWVRNLPSEQCRYRWQEPQTRDQS